MATVYVEGKPYAMNAEENLLHGCLSHGFDLPYFCWHPALGSVGACRQCAVKQFKDEKDSSGKIVMACVTAAAEGTRISIRDPEAVSFRKTVIEGLMLNHPHDCPVCDEGGECHLQDMTVMTGHDYRRYRFDKRTFRNQNLGPLVNQEMNRCIQCYRCVRYYRDYAGGRDLNVFGLRDLVFFGREQDGALENEFGGNLVEICPTGVFTDKTLKHRYTRKWDQLFAPSVCVHCGVGCNTDVGERYGTVRRVLNRYHHEVNGYFLCDRGRFGYEFVNNPNRIREPLLNGRPVDAAFAAGYVRETAVRGQAIGIGSPRASLETNFALRSLVGAEHSYSGFAEREWRVLAAMIEAMRRVRPPSLREIEESDAVLILGEDLINSAPRVALSLRQAVRRPQWERATKLKIPLWQDQGVREAGQDAKAPLFIASPFATRLDEIATATVRAAPDDIARLGFAIAHELDRSGPRAGDFAEAEQIARALSAAKRPLVIGGASLVNEAMIRAAANVALAAEAMLYLAAPECNSIGAAMLGGGTIEQALEALRRREADTVIVAENDLFRRAPASVVEELCRHARLIVLDSLPNETTARAEVVLPAATFAESTGTFVSSEGRAQRFFEVLPPADPVRPSFRWLGSWNNLDEILRAMAAEMPQLTRAIEAAPLSTFRIAEAKIPRAPHRFSGRTAIGTEKNVSEPPPPPDFDSPLAFSMEGSELPAPAPLIPFFWTPCWNSIQATNFYQREIGGPLRGGNAGVRLFDGARGGRFDGEIPQPFEARPDEWLFVPSYHLFGSEELSAWAPAIGELAAKPYVAMKNAAFPNGAMVTVTVQGQHFRLRVETREEIPPGIAVLPANIPPLLGSPLPARGRISLG